MQRAAPNPENRNQVQTMGAARIESRHKKSTLIAWELSQHKNIDIVPALFVVFRAAGSN